MMSSASRRSAVRRFIGESPLGVSRRPFTLGGGPAAGPQWPCKDGLAIRMAIEPREVLRRFPAASVVVHASILFRSDHRRDASAGPIPTDIIYLCKPPKAAEAVNVGSHDRDHRSIRLSSHIRVHRGIREALSKVSPTDLRIHRWKQSDTNRQLCIAAGGRPEVRRNGRSYHRLDLRCCAVCCGISWAATRPNSRGCKLNATSDWGPSQG